MYARIFALLFMCGFAAAAEPEYPLSLSKAGIELPSTEDTELTRLLSSPKTIFYKLPQVWQQYIPASRVEHTDLLFGTKSYSSRDASWGVYFSPFLSDFNANPLFPWETTAGLNEKKGDDIYGTVDFINLPDDSLGNTVPILIINEKPIKWIFPEGTTVGEVIYVVHKGAKHVQEIRTRKKTTGSTEWEPKLYRPIGSREEFIRTAGLADYTPAKRYVFLRNPQEDEVFKMEGMVERLPPLPEDRVTELLKYPFKDVTDVAPWSPSADQDYHILPRNYCFSLLESVNVITCADCHRQTQTSVRNLVPKEPLIVNNPDKVGNIRGCDAVFTWYPFTNSSVRNSDKEPKPGLSFRQYDIEKKTVAVWKPGTKGYKITKFVQDSLRDYELPPKELLHTKDAVNVEPKR